MVDLFAPFQLGNMTLKNRIVMPPMTRSRANNPGHVSNTELMAPYYAQRTGAGLIVSEGTQVSPRGQGYAWTPGIYSPEQTKAWKVIVEEVHKKDGIFFAQLWHVGRVSRPSLLGGLLPLAPSALAPQNVRVFVEEDGKADFKPVLKPQEMTLKDIQEAVEAYRLGAANAMEAGFDGIELHGANGYLINQFIDSGANHRTDAYGGSVENRLRFLREVTEAVIDVAGAHRVGVRLAPLTTTNDCKDDNPEETYAAAARLLDKLGVLYIHIAEADWDDAPTQPAGFRKTMRKAYNGCYIYAGKYTKQKALEALESGWSDLIAFGRPFVSNPDLVERLRHDYPLAPHDPQTLFGVDAKGLIDYPLYGA